MLQTYGPQESSYVKEACSRYLICNINHWSCITTFLVKLIEEVYSVFREQKKTIYKSC